MTAQVAKRDLVRSRGRAALGMIKMIDQFIQEEVKYDLVEESERRLKKIRLSRKRYRRHATIRAWEEQTSKGDPDLLDRTKALLLLGDTRAGKTARASDNQPLRETMLVNCQGLEGGALPDISRAHVEGKTTVIWEEITVQQVIRNKRVFQSAPNITQLGDSACHVATYHVLPAKLRHILCTNDFPMTQQECKELTPANEEYLQKNFFVPLLPDGVVWWLEDDEPDEEMTNEVALQKGAARLYPEMQAILGGG